MKIGEFSEKVGLSVFTLRYYEDEGLIRPQRDENNRRYYTDQDARWLMFVLHLKGTGMTVEEIQQYIKLRAIGDSTILERKELLKKVSQRAKNEIKELQANLRVINHKIDWYSGKLDSTISDSESFKEYLERMGEQSD